MKSLGIPSVAIAAGPIIAAGMMAIALATPHGLGYSHDSVFYWSGAVNLLDGNGFARLGTAGEPVPITHFPPLYSGLLALGSKLSDSDLLSVGRGLAALLMSLNLGLLWILIWRATGSAAAAAATGMLALSAPSLVERHLWALSEPLYFALLLLAFGALAQAIEQQRDGWLIAAAVAAGLVYLTRYVGLAAILAGLVVLALRGGVSLRERLRRAGLFAALSLIPGLVWQARNQLVAGTLSNRVFGWHPPSLDQLRVAGGTLASWVPIGALPTVLRAALIGLTGALLLMVAMRKKTEGDGTRFGHALFFCSTAYGVIYIALLLISLTFFDASTRLDQRIFSPIFLVGLIGVTLAAWPVLVRNRSAGSRIGLIAALIALVLLQARPTITLLQESARDGLGFSSSDWSDSEVVEAVRQLDPDVSIYSNQALALYFLTGRPAASVPERTDPVKGAPRAEYGELLRSMQQRLWRGEAVLVLFDYLTLPPELPSLLTLTRGLHPMLIADQGAIFGLEGDAG